MNDVTLGDVEYKLSDSLDGVEQYLYKSYLDDLDKCLPSEKPLILKISKTYRVKSMNPFVLLN